MTYKEEENLRHSPYFAYILGYLTNNVSTYVIEVQI